MNELPRFLLCLLAVWWMTPEAVVPAQEGKVRSGVLTLQQSVRMALDHSPEMVLAQTQSQRAAESLREVQSLNLPQVVTGTGLAYNNGFPLSLEGSAPSVIQIGVSQAILSKKNRNLIQEAREGRRASEISGEAMRMELAARTALLYCELHQARKLVSLCEERLESARKQESLTDTLLHAGRVRPVDLTLARAESAQAAQQLLVAKERASLSESALREALALPSTTPIETEDPKLDLREIEGPAESLFRRALETHPEILQAETSVRAKEFHFQAERGEFYPRLDLVGQYALFSRFNNYQDYFNRFTRNNYLLGLSIQVPIFTGFRNNARVAQSRHEVTEAKLKLQRAKSELKSTIEQETSALRVAQGAFELARLSAAAAQESLEASIAQYEAGRIGGVDLERARVQVQDKRIGVIDAEKALWQRRIELLRAINSLSPLL